MLLKKRKTFECGHRGFGKYCHLCRDIELGRIRKNDVGKYEKVEVKKNE